MSYSLIAQSVRKQQSWKEKLHSVRSAFHCELQSCPRGQIFMFAWGADGPCAAYSTSWTSWTSLLERLGSLSLQSHTIAIKHAKSKKFSVNELHALVDGNVVPQPFEAKAKQSSLFYIMYSSIHFYTSSSQKQYQVISNNARLSFQLKPRTSRPLSKSCRQQRSCARYTLHTLVGAHRMPRNSEHSLRIW